MKKSEPVFPKGTDSPLLAAARRHLLQLWNDQHDARLVFHNFAQAAGVAAHVAEFLEQENLPEAAGEVALLSAWFHNVGYLYDAARPVEAGAIRAEFFLAEQGCAPDKIQQVRQCITAALAEGRPETPEACTLSDALRAYDWVDTFDARVPLLRLERELLSGHPVNDADWARYVDDQLRQCRFFTAFAKTNYEPVLALRLLERRSTFPAVQATDSPEPKKPKTGGSGRFDRLARRPLRSSIQTYFRANYGTHIRLSAIADNKAHIMISVNSILLSVAISLLTYQTLTNRNPLYVLPIIMFLVTSLASLIFAVLSSRPRVTNVVPVSGQAPNPVFFGNFVHLSLDQYEAATDAMLRDGRLLFGNMARDLYFLGQVLDKKYRLLTYSYTVFMMGFVATVGAFIGAYFLGE